MTNPNPNKQTERGELRKKITTIIHEWIRDCGLDVQDVEQFVNREIMCLITAHEQIIYDWVEKKLIGSGEVHVSHVCPQDSIPCREFQARSKLRAEQRLIFNKKRPHQVFISGIAMIKKRKGSR